MAPLPSSSDRVLIDMDRRIVRKRIKDVNLP
jgi:hypothetical protein